MLRKITLASLVLAGSLFAETYIGVDFGYGSNDTDKAGTTYSNNYTDLALILGTGENGGIKVQGRINFVSYDKQVFVDGDSALEVGVDIIKEFAAGSSLYPYLKAGVGGDYMSVNENIYDQPIVLGFEFNAGVGVNVMATEDLGIIIGIDYKYRKWQDVDYRITTVSTSDSGLEPYFGLRYNF